MHLLFLNCKAISGYLKRPMKKADFQRLKKSIQEMVEIEKGEKDVPRKFIYSGKVLVQVEENDKVIWKLEEAANRLNAAYTSNKPTTQAEFIKSARDYLRQSQEGFAELLGIPLTTLQGWEQGRRNPGAAASTLLKVVATNPLAVLHTKKIEFA